MSNNLCHRNAANPEKKKKNFMINSQVLKRYWDLSLSKVEETVQRFDKLYLLETITVDGEMYCSLHYHYYSYLKSHVSSCEKVKMHRTLVNNYRINEALQNRTELYIADLPNDEYFHFYIGYHLKEANMHSLFADLYLDFGFIEQKLRYTRLPNTLGDFNVYHNAIVGNVPKRNQFIDELTDFLANIEEILIRTPDTCLLQYALTASASIRLEAQKQAQRYANRIWFSDM